MSVVKGVELAQRTRSSSSQSHSSWNELFGLKAAKMSMRVLVASGSAYRRCWYVEQLTPCGMNVFTAVDGLDCVAQMRSLQPDIVLLEPALLWGGSQGILALRSEEPELQNTPVVLMAVDGVTSEWYQLARYSVQGLLLRRPSGESLASTLLAAIHETHRVIPV